MNSKWLGLPLATFVHKWSINPGFGSKGRNERLVLCRMIPQKLPRSIPAPRNGQIGDTGTLLSRRLVIKTAERKEREQFGHDTSCTGVSVDFLFTKFLPWLLFDVKPQVANLRLRFEEKAPVGSSSLQLNVKTCLQAHGNTSLKDKQNQANVLRKCLRHDVLKPKPELVFQSARSDKLYCSLRDQPAEKDANIKPKKPLSPTFPLQPTI